MIVGNAVRNLMLKHPGLRRFKWTSIQVNDNTVARKHVDSGNVGVSLTMGFGDYEGGEFTTQGKEYDIRHRAVLVDGAIEHGSKPFTGRRFSVILFAHSAWKKRLLRNYRKSLQCLDTMSEEGVVVDHTK